jgi:hypothetical protein
MGFEYLIGGGVVAFLIAYLLYVLANAQKY